MKKFLIILFALLLTGCETHQEISDLGMVSAVGVEKTNNEYLISAQVVNIKKNINQGGDTSSKVVLYEGTGKTIFEAIRKITTKSSKKLYFAHMKLFIIDAEIINEDPFQVIDFISRDNEGKLNSYVLVSLENTPHEILSTITPFEDVPAEYIFNTALVSEANYGNTYSLTFENFINSLLITESNLAYTKISILNNEGEKNNTEKLNSINLPANIVLGNILVINKENKLVELSSEESKIFNLLKGNAINGIATLECNNDKNNYYTIELLHNKRKMELNEENNELSFILNTTFSISDYNCNKSITDTKNIETLKKEIGEYIKKNINLLLKKSVDYESDFLEISTFIKSRHKNYFDFKNNNWQKEGLKNLKFKIDVKVQLENRGDLLNIIKKEEDKNE